MSFQFAFFASVAICSLAFLLAAFQVAKNTGGSANYRSRFFLALFVLTASLGLAEMVSWIFETAARSMNKRPPAPLFLSKHEAAPHILIKDSILYLMPTNSNMKTFGHKFKTNGMGFRETNFIFKKNPDTFRILAFGDSLTFGVGIDLDHRYTNLLEDMLNYRLENAKNPDINKKRIEILNFGMPGYSLDQEHDLMKAILKIVECDLVMVGIIDDDLNMTTKTALDGFTFNFGKDRVEIALYKNFERNYDTIPQAEPDEFMKPPPLFGKLAFFRLLKDRTALFSDYNLPNAARWEYARKQFLGMRELTKQNGLPPPLVVLLNYGSVDPAKNDFKNPGGRLAVVVKTLQFVGGELKRENFDVVDTLPLFQEHNRMSMAVSEWEWHPNYLAHFLYAQSIFNHLTEKGIVP